MTPGARLAAAADILDVFLDGAPADKVLANWARSNRYAGSKDRAAVRDIVFDCLRNLRSFQHYAGHGRGRGLTIGYCLDHDLDLGELFTGEGYAAKKLSSEEIALTKGEAAHPGEAVLANVPEWVLPILKESLSDRFSQGVEQMAQRAPVDLRVNVSKGTLENAQVLLAEDGVSTEPVLGVPTALRVVENPRRVANSKAYVQGFVELQDAASQAVVDIFDLKPGMTVLDYCAGGGGKTLAIAAKCPKVKVSAWDIEPRRLEPLKERAVRAGSKVKVLGAVDPSAFYDLVVVDAPCSGSGAWRRNPEGKWRLSEEDFADLLKTQLEVLSKAAENVKPGGVLAYVTCSLLKPENGAVAARLLDNSSGFIKTFEKSYELGNPGDGFFCALLQKQL